MKIKEYMTPEMEVVKLKFQTTLLAGSSIDDSTEGGNGGGNVDDPNVW